MQSPVTLGDSVVRHDPRKEPQFVHQHLWIFAKTLRGERKRRCPGSTFEGPGAPNVTQKVHLKSDQILGTLLGAHGPAHWHQKGPQGHQIRSSFKHFGCRWGLQGMFLLPLGNEDAKQRRCNMQQTKKLQHSKQKTAVVGIQ